LDEKEKLILKMASLLHDIGHFIGTQNHDSHGYYILKNSPLIGLDEHQQALIAVLVGHHRKTTGRDQEHYFKTLNRKDQAIINRLCALLRLADAIEVSHTNRVREVKMIQNKHCWQLQMVGEGNLLLERWTLSKRKTLFEEVFETQLEVLDEKFF
jgi:exopolyphosphatase/guanosine-5'-triphosphate,3'-diphosphate pyrophosphatase